MIFCHVLRKNGFLFKQGSTWTYINQSSDTEKIVLTTVETGFTEPCPKNDCPLKEFYKLTYNNISNATTFNNYLCDFQIKYNGGGAWGEGGQPIFIANTAEGADYCGLTVGQTLDSLQIFSSVFYNVKIMILQKQNQCQNEFNTNIEFYFAPNVGIIRKVIDGAETWDLLSYHIE